MKKIFLLLLFILSCDRKVDFKTEAQKLLKPFKVELKEGLQTGITHGGPVQALHACKTLAPAISEKHKLKNVTIGRTSHKLRNPINTPKPWMEPLLKEYLSSNLENPLPGKVIKGKGFRAYVEPIYTQAVCLTCHGAKVPALVQEKIKKLYPNDKAMGFKKGEFRGLFWVKETL